MGLCTILKPCLKGENINITKNDLNFFLSPKILISFKKLKIFSGEISLNNMRSDLAVKWLSLISNSFVEGENERTSDFFY